MIEQDIENGIKTPLATAVDGLLSAPVLIRTFWDEPVYAAGDEEIQGNNITIHAMPSSRESGQLTQRIVQVIIECATYLMDDKDRRDLALLYGKVRYTLETTTYDFGETLTYTANSYEIASVGESTIEEGWNLASLTIEFNVCAAAYE
jgi:hypothetical protein